MLLARYEAKEILEKIPATQSRLLHEENFNPETPGWAVPEWFGEKPKVEYPSPEQIREADTTRLILG